MLTESPHRYPVLGVPSLSWTRVDTVGDEVVSRIQTTPKPRDEGFSLARVLGGRSHVPPEPPVRKKEGT